MFSGGIEIVHEMSQVSVSNISIKPNGPVIRKHLTTIIFFLYEIAPFVKGKFFRVHLYFRLFYFFSDFFFYRKETL